MGIEEKTEQPKKRKMNFESTVAAVALAGMIGGLGHLFYTNHKHPLPKPTLAVIQVYKLEDKINGALKARDYLLVEKLSIECEQAYSNHITKSEVADYELKLKEHNKGEVGFGIFFLSAAAGTFLPLAYKDIKHFIKKTK